MVRFDVEQGAYGTRTLRLEGTDTVVGWIESGRKMVDLNGKRWTEWGFIPDGDYPDAGLPLRDNIADAYADARNYAKEMLQK